MRQLNFSSRITEFWIPASAGMTTMSIEVPLFGTQNRYLREISVNQ